MAASDYYFFAVTKVQYKYFNLVNDYLGQTEGHVLYNKKTKSPCFHRIPYKGISEIADLAVSTRENCSKYRRKSKLYFKLYKLVKFVDASWRYVCYSSEFKKNSVRNVVVWNGLKYNQLIIRLAAERHNAAVIFMENGLVPGMTTLDQKGVNFGNSAPRDIDYYLGLGCPELASEKRFQQTNSKYIFVPFQVNTDSQIVSYSPWIKNMDDLFNIICEAAGSLPDNYRIVFKLHPMCPEPYADLISKSSDYQNIVFDNDTATEQLIRHADAICTINSTVGIEGLLSEKKVIVLGNAFYGIEGLTKSARCIDELNVLFEEIDYFSVNRRAISGFKKYLTETYQVCGSWVDADEAHLASLKNKLEQLSSNASNG